MAGLNELNHLSPPPPPRPQPNMCLHQVMRATSFFSLAPLRFTGAPPFEPARCLTTGAVAEKVSRRHEKLRNAYQRGTWGRRWVVRLALWAGFVLAMMAMALLAAGRQLQHRCTSRVLYMCGFFVFVAILLDSVKQHRNNCTSRATSYVWLLCVCCHFFLRR